MRIFSRLAIGLLAGAIVLTAAPAAFAQDEAATSSLAALTDTTELRQVSGATVTMIQNVAVMNMLDADAATWASLGGLEMILTVQSQEPICPPAKPGMVTCQALGFKSYEIRVTAATEKRAKDRTPLKDEIQVGDRINAYGAFDASTGRMDAQIVRDLDKPFSSRLLQLDGLRVVNVEQGKDGIQVEAVRGSGPCWNYLAGARLSHPCPAGTQPSPTVRLLRLPEGYDVANVYSISVPRTATLLDVNRKPLSASAVTVGDTVNAYGSLVAPGMMQAQVFRVTVDADSASSGELKISVPSGSAFMQVGDETAIDFAVSGGTAPYRWTVSGAPTGLELVSTGVIACFAAPCPQPDTARATLSGTPAEAGSFIVRIEVSDAAGAGRYLEVPVTVSSDGDDDAEDGIEVSVRTDRSSYRADQTIGIDVVATNVSDEERTMTFTSGCHADYDVLPGFSLRTVQLCTLAVGSVTLEPGESKEYHFEHDLESHALPKRAFPFNLTVVGRIVGVGEDSTTVRVTASR